MRTRHDTVPDGVFQEPAGKPPFSNGANRINRDDIALALELSYEEMGWDKSTGAPTSVAYQRVGLGEDARTLAEKGLLP